MSSKRFILSKAQVEKIGKALVGETEENLEKGIEISGGGAGYALVIESDILLLQNRSEPGGKKEIEEKIIQALEREGFGKYWRKQDCIVFSSEGVPGVILEVAYSQKSGALIELKKP
jgi:hypothetical protein